MREIKFRVWSTKENKWMFGYEYPNLGGFSLVGETILCGEFGKYQLDRYFNDFVIMQYTGLNDKKGKEIYEGDIIKILNGEIVGMEMGYEGPQEKYKDLIATVIYHEASFSYFHPNGDCYVPIDYSINDTIVIGNIHEPKTE
jgi:uncharacterized phage protein (TIGR01671 family)